MANYIVWGVELWRRSYMVEKQRRSVRTVFTQVAFVYDEPACHFEPRLCRVAVEGSNRPQNQTAGKWRHFTKRADDLSIVISDSYILLPFKTEGKISRGKRAAQPPLIFEEPAQAKSSFFFFSGVRVPMSVALQQ